MRRNIDGRIFGHYEVPNKDVRRLRVYKDLDVWFLDGADESGSGYSIEYRCYDSFAEAVENIEAFASAFCNLERRTSRKIEQIALTLQTHWRGEHGPLVTFSLDSDRYKELAPLIRSYSIED